MRVNIGSNTMGNNLDYIAKWTREKCKSINLKINRETHPEVIKKLETVPSMCGYIIELIERDIKN